jgi:hypothetical protein
MALGNPGHIGPADRRNSVPTRVKDHPFLTLMAAVSAVLILAGRVNKDMWWGNWAFIAGIAVLVVAGALFVLRR